MTRPRLLDLFCGAGGAAMGYYRAGFEVVGVDIHPQPRYPFTFFQMDTLEALQILLEGGYIGGSIKSQWLTDRGDEATYDAIHASPPCQWITQAAVQWRKAGREYPELLEPTRSFLAQIGLPYIIEQPVGQVLHNPIKLNGASFGLRVKRDRYFECTFAIDMPLLAMEERPRKMGRPFDAPKGELFYPVGHFSGVAQGRAAMGIDWYMTQQETAQALCPAYTEYIGGWLIKAVTP